jgi:hypothetical protein
MWLISSVSAVSEVCAGHLKIAVYLD